MKQDRSYTDEFLSAIGGGVFNFQAMPDSASGPAKQFRGTMDELWPELCRLNDDGNGVFVQVNRSCSEDFKAGSIVSIRALFMDDDVGDLMDKNPPYPSIVVHSGRGVHVYYLTDDQFPIDSFEGMQSSLAKKYGTDQSIKNLNRIMRLPGFLHVKKSPKLVTCDVLNTTMLSIGQIIDLVGVLPDTKTTTVVPLDVAKNAVNKASLSDRVRSCVDFMRELPGAVSGNMGDMATYMACLVGGDFGLSDDEFWPILSSWNSRCLPPWDDNSLRKKLSNANAYRKEPEGWRLVDDEESLSEIYTTSRALAVYDKYGGGEKIPTGVVDLDNQLHGGLPVGQITMILGQTGVGKSEFVRQISRTAASRSVLEPIGVIHVDMELGIERITQRYLCQSAKVGSNAIAGMSDGDPGYSSIEKAREEYSRLPIVLVWPHKTKTLDGLEALLTKAEEKLALDAPKLLILDSLQRLSKLTGEQDYRAQVTEFMRWAERFSREHRYAVVFPAEQKRLEEGSFTASRVLSSGAESRSIEYQADVVIGLHQLPDRDGSGRRVQIMVAKCRDGSTGLCESEIEYVYPYWGMRVRAAEHQHDSAIMGFLRSNGAMDMAKLATNVFIPSKILSARVNRMIDVGYVTMLNGKIQLTDSGERAWSESRGESDQ